MIRRSLIWKIAVAVLFASFLALPQRGRHRNIATYYDLDVNNPAVDPRKLTFVRIKYTMKELQFNQIELPPWGHDVPRADRHFMKIIQEFTGIAVNEDT